MREGPTILVGPSLLFGGTLPVRGCVPTLAVMMLPTAATRGLLAAVSLGAVHLLLLPGQWLSCLVAMAAGAFVAATLGPRIAFAAAQLHARVVLSASPSTWLLLAGAFALVTVLSASAALDPRPVLALAGALAVTSAWVFGSVLLVAHWAQAHRREGHTMEGMSSPPRTWPGRSVHVQAPDALARIVVLAFFACLWALGVADAWRQAGALPPVAPLAFAVAVLVVLRVAWDCALWRLDLARTPIHPGA